jgi:uncharacterized protein (TIGR02757 family)
VTNKELHSFLEENYERYNRPDFIPSDPVSVPHLFSKKQDIEIAGFLSATIAWGQRPVILRNANELMRRMDLAPYDFILNHTTKERARFSTFKHRTFNGTDCVFFMKSLQHIYRKHRSLEAVFKGSDVRSALINFRKIFFSIPHPARTEKHVSDPEVNSAAKKLNLFLRWMVRKDDRGVDFGIWKNLSPKNLMCPLDVHSGNVARKLGLLARKQNDWKSVEELTSRLRAFDPNDPVKYDFALFSIGESGSR